MGERGRSNDVSEVVAEGTAAVEAPPTWSAAKSSRVVIVDRDELVLVERARG